MRTINARTINTIKRIANGKLGELYPEHELDLAISNYDYYVGPGYLKKLFNLLFEAIGTNAFNHALGPNIPEIDKIPILLGGLVHLFFDKEYFEEQIDKCSSKVPIKSYIDPTTDSTAASAVDPVATAADSTPIPTTEIISFDFSF